MEGRRRRRREHHLSASHNGPRLSGGHCRHGTTGAAVDPPRHEQRDTHNRLFTYGRIAGRFAARRRRIGPGAANRRSNRRGGRVEWTGRGESASDSAIRERRVVMRFPAASSAAPVAVTPSVHDPVVVRHAHAALAPAAAASPTRHARPVGRTMLDFRSRFFGKRRDVLLERRSELITEAEQLNAAQLEARAPDGLGRAPSWWRFVRASGLAIPVACGARIGGHASVARRRSRRRFATRRRSTAATCATPRSAS